MLRNLVLLAVTFVLGLSGPAPGTNYWVNFATTGDPNGKVLPKWTPYDPSAEAYLDFGDTIQIRNHLLKAQLDFIELFQKRR